MKIAMKKKKMTAPKVSTRSTFKRSSGKSNTPRKRESPLASVIPGEVILGAGDIVAFHGKPTVELTVANTGDRPIQVGSHCHFFESNRALRFDREAAYGFRLQVPAGTAVRFEPGEEKRVTLVAIGGNRVAYGINGLVNGRLDDAKVRKQALAKAVEQGFMKRQG